ncbi:hypothetical protein [Indiicoccus explosivorum]|uniref:hypothetical protein n=1 Tax=Indiicoccus explosivorum TaxID=1917864 RepID=UPI000B4415E9|nr:hypothetical protein [Indiicoccus explosivorum]
MLTDAYRKLWQDRKAIENIRSEEELEAWIAMELNDELTHPRLRRKRSEKFRMAMERIEQSGLTGAEKSALEDLYRRVLERQEGTRLR